MSERPEPTMAVRSWLQHLESRSDGRGDHAIRAAITRLTRHGARAVGDGGATAIVSGSLRAAGLLARDAAPLEGIDACESVLDAVADNERSNAYPRVLVELVQLLAVACDDDPAALLDEPEAPPAERAEPLPAEAAEALAALATALHGLDGDATHGSTALSLVLAASGGDRIALVTTSGTVLSVERRAGARSESLESFAVAWAERILGPAAPAREATNAVAPANSDGARIRVLPLGVRGEGPVGVLAVSNTSCARGLRAATAQLALALSLQRNQKAARDAVARFEERARAERETLSVISHDLRNPLSAILMSVALLQRSHRTDGSPTTRQIEVIKRSADRINYLLQNVSDSVSVELGQLTVDPKPEALGAMVDDCLRMLGPQAQHKSVRIESEVPADAPEILADRERFVQTLANVLAARIRMAPRGGAVSVRARRNGSSVHVSVSGAAPGIPDEEVRQWFDRAYWSRPNASPSTGIALSVARSIVEAHGGKMWAEPGNGAGPAVEFTLPIATDEQIAAARAPASNELSS